MPELLLSIYFSYKNAQIAKAKGLNTIIWVLLTLFAFFAGEIIASAIAVILFYHGPIDRKSIDEFLFVHPDPVRVIFTYFAGLGGYLFIRHMLERRRSNLPETTKDDNREEDNYE